MFVCLFFSLSSCGLESLKFPRAETFLGHCLLLVETDAGSRFTLASRKKTRGSLLNSTLIWWLHAAGDEPKTNFLLQTYRKKTEKKKHWFFLLLCKIPTGPGATITRWNASFSFFFFVFLSSHFRVCTEKERAGPRKLSFWTKLRNNRKPFISTRFSPLGLSFICGVLVK